MSASGAAAETPGQRAASVASSRSGRRRPLPDASEPLSVSEFIAQLHVHDLSSRFGKEKEELKMTTATPRTGSILQPGILDSNETALLKRFAKAHQMASSFRKAKLRASGQSRDTLRQQATAVLPYAKQAVESGLPGLPVRLQNEEGQIEDYYVKPHLEKRKGPAPGLGAALDCVSEAAEAVLKAKAPELLTVRVTPDNLHDVLRVIMQPDVGSSLMNHIEEAVNEYQRALGTTVETVHLVKKKEAGKPPSSENAGTSSRRRPIRYRGQPT